MPGTRRVCSSCGSENAMPVPFADLQLQYQTIKSEIDGAIATYSFYPGKNLGASGDAGAAVTGDAALAEHMTMLARHGGLVKHQHQIEGINSRLDGMQAAILSAKLPHLAAWTEARQR